MRLTRCGLNSEVVFFFEADMYGEGLFGTDISDLVLRVVLIPRWY